MCPQLPCVDFFGKIFRKFWFLTIPGRNNNFHLDRNLSLCCVLLCQFVAIIYTSTFGAFESIYHSYEHKPFVEKMDTSRFECDGFFSSWRI